MSFAGNQNSVAFLRFLKRSANRIATRTPPLDREYEGIARRDPQAIARTISEP